MNGGRDVGQATNIGKQAANICGAGNGRILSYCDDESYDLLFNLMNGGRDVGQATNIGKQATSIGDAVNKSDLQC